MRPRIQSIDILRGLAMMIMALDHTRDFFHSGAIRFDPADVTKTTALLFFTRWITHFCAPAFMFLAGTSAYLQLERGKSKPELAKFLITRGLWLVLLEWTWVMCIGWKLNFDYNELYMLVIWALGMSMVALAGLIFLPWRALLALSLAGIALHNLLDPLQLNQWWAKILHTGGTIQLTDHLKLGAGYPLIPWIFAMSTGFCFGRLIPGNSRMLIRLGVAITLGFCLLRATNLYGDPHPWSVQPSLAMTIASFGNVNKYPPSLLFLAMTLGPALILLGVLAKVQLKDTNPFLIFGRVPMFYYLIHLPLIHGLAVLFAQVRYGHAEFMYSSLGALPGFPKDYGYNLGAVYLIWLAILAALYPACRWFAGVKRGNKSVVLSYF